VAESVGCVAHIMDGPDELKEVFEGFRSCFIMKLFLFATSFFFPCFLNTE
jgi:hypothetical protein